MTTACALTVAGLDPGGGAGILADLRSFAAAGAFGCAIAALLTVQSTSGLSESHPVDSRLVARQLEEILRLQRVNALKTGALGTASNVRVVARALRDRRRRLSLVIDPVMLPTAGRSRLLSRSAVQALRDDLVPLSTLVTANAPEAAALTGRTVLDVEDARRAALDLVRRGARAAMVKGGHLTRSPREVVDVLAIGGRVFELRAPRLVLPPLHGGGCVLASLVAGRLAVTGDASDAGLLRAVRWARRAHYAALRAPVDVGGGRRVLAFK